MRFTINLATRAYYNRKRVRRTIGALMVLFLVVLAWNLVLAARTHGEAARMAAEIAAGNERLNARPAGVSVEEYSRVMTSIKFYNAIIDRKIFNWLALLDQLEGVTPEGIALTAFSPDLKTGALKIDGRTKSFSMVKGYLERLEDSGDFQNTFLQSHREAFLGDRNREVQFTVTSRMAAR